MARALASNLLQPRPGRAEPSERASERAQRAEHTLALQLPSPAVHDRAL